MPTHRKASIVVFLLATQALALPGFAQTLVSSGGGGDPSAGREASSACISEQQRAAAVAQADANAAALGILSARGPGIPTYTFWPQAGTLGRDLFMNNFVDLNSTTSILDYSCADWTYDGHTGHDIDLRSFSEQIVGVPIFAALDGTVVATADGNPDMNTTWGNQPANYVILDHGNGHRTYYWHMKLGSVAVAVGQIVRAGQQIGLTGSSGISTGPHLHFESSQNGAVYEPFAGACRGGASAWALQPNPDRTTTYLRDFGFSNTSLSSFVGPPQPYPRTSHLSFADQFGYYWMQGHNLPPNAQIQFRFIRPNGTTAFASTPSSPSWATGQFRWWWAWYSWNIPEMRTIAGTWHVQILINGTMAIDAPVEVRAVRDSAFNRPPNPITLALDPPAPTPAGPVFCRVTSDMLLDDPDYDVVRYRYTWRVNGVVARDVTSAALSDALPKGAFVAGMRISCAVTPSDGLLSGVTSNITFGCRADFNGGGLTVSDIFDFLAAWFAQDPRADFNGGGATVSDIFDFLAAWFAGC